MKYSTDFKRFIPMILLVGTISVSTVSCKQEVKDTEEVAEDQNEERFEHDDAKDDAAEFMVDAAGLNHKEIQLGKLAQRSTNADVKAHGKMMEDAHTTNFNELKMLAEQKQITVPMSVTEDGMDAYNKLNDKQGAEFDKEYLKMMVDKHEEAVKDFEEFVGKSEDAEIKAWAAKTLETLKSHLAHTTSLRDKYKN